MERASQFNSEYFDGYVQAMSGASLKHNIIERNLISSLANFLKGKECQFLKGKECQALPSHMRVTTLSPDSYMYPDALIVSLLFTTRGANFSFIRKYLHSKNTL